MAIAMDPTELAFAGIARQAELIAAGELSSRELVELYLERIEALDPHLNAFRVVLAERALAEADQATARLRGGDARPLLGVPVAIKDDADVAGEVTAFGAATYGPTAAADAEVVRLLRAAGAIVIGKTNVPELTQWPFTESTTWGATRNPWNLGRTPSGSSGGSAAAVAAGLVGAALGSDGGGSIRTPAACCGIFGLKPQRGRISYGPLAEHWHGLSVYGPLTRSVADAALFLDVAAGSEAQEFARAAQAEPGRLRIAVSARPPLPGPVDPDCRRVLEETAELLRSLGHDVRAQNPSYGTAIPNFIARYLRGIHDDARALPEPRRLERRTRTMARAGALATPRVLARVRAAEAGVTERLGRLFDEHDVLLTPALASPPVEIGRWEGRGALWTFNGVARHSPFAAPWNVTGQPAAAVPAGETSDGLPLAVQAVGRPGAEATMLSLARQLECARPWADRRPAMAI